MTAPRRTRIKFCGVTSTEDVALAVDAGADAIGVIVAESSRRVPLDRLAAIAAAIPPYVDRIGVLADQGDDEARALRALGFTLQFSGEESPERCAMLAGGQPYIKAFHIDPLAPAFDTERYRRYAGALWMFDTNVAGSRGGTGTTFPAELLAPLAREHRLVLSGGLTPENVAQRIALVRPYAVDVRSGVETADRKDAAKMHAFTRAVYAGERSEALR